LGIARSVAGGGKRGEKMNAYWNKLIGNLHLNPVF